MAALEGTHGERRVRGVVAAAGASGRWPRHVEVPALIVGSWAILLAAELTGAAAALHHHALIEGGMPLTAAVPLFLVGWLVMAAAMMLPASLRSIRMMEAPTASVFSPGRARAAFMASFALVWVAFGLIAFLGDVGLHRIVDPTPWLAGRPWLIEAGILALAGGYQLTPLKRRSLAACRHPDRSAITTSAVPGGSARGGLRHGIDCLGSSWALMLLMFAEGFASIGWMVALTILMAYEATGREGQRAASLAGVALVLAALASLSGAAAGGL
jgi:predicted metal-binding membrane protein